MDGDIGKDVVLEIQKKAESVVASPSFGFMYKTANQALVKACVWVASFSEIEKSSHTDVLTLANSSNTEPSELNAIHDEMDMAKILHYTEGRNYP